jgi:chromosome partitioning protein
MKAKVVCISNLKGGVSKTTLVMALAEYLSGDTAESKRVLAIDLDPQSNLTSALMPEDIWGRQFESKGLTLPYLFKNPDFFLDTYQNDEFIVKSSISNVRKGNSFNCLHLIPSSPVLFEIQEYLPRDNYPLTTLKPVNLLQEILQPLLSKYDYILIDCPPTLNQVIKSAFLASHYCIIPCVPNQMSIHGLDLVLKHIDKFNNANQHNLKPLGIIISRFNGTLAQTECMNFIKGNPFFPEVFQTKIPEKAKVREALDFSNQLTYKQKYADSHYVMSQLAQEFIQKVG